jgi:hypothetical protein
MRSETKRGEETMPKYKVIIEEEIIIEAEDESDAVLFKRWRVSILVI